MHVSVLFFHPCLAFCIALSLFLHNIVMLWLWKWQLTSWVGVNAPVHSVASEKRTKQVININNMQSPQKKDSVKSSNRVQSYLLSCEWRLSNTHQLISSVTNTQYCCSICRSCMFLCATSVYQCQQFCTALSPSTVLHTALWWYYYVNGNLHPE